MSRVHCRCRACGARQTKPKAPEEYVTAPVCRGCKAKWYRPRNLGKNVVCSPVPALRVDTWANARSWRKHTCYCDGYHHPHRIGSRWCYENPCYGHTTDELGTERSPFYHQHDEEEEHEQYCTDGEPGDGACFERTEECHGEGGVVPPRARHEHTDPGRRAGHELQQPVTQTTGESDMDNSRHSSVPPPVRRGPDGRTVADKLKAMGWTQVVSIQGLAGGGKVRHAEPVFYVDFCLKTALGFGNSRTHWRTELRRMPTGKWSLLLRGPGTSTTVAARQAEELDMFEDPIAATMALKLEGDGSIPKGVRAWRMDTFGWLPGVVEEIAQ